MEVAEKSHAILGPSGWHTWANCPGSVPLSEGVPSHTSSYAKEGTAAHSLLERCLGENANAEDFIGEEYTVEGETFVVDQEMADAVNSAIEIVRAELDDGAILQTEQTVPIAFLTGETDAEGTCDIAILSQGGTKLTIMDFKYGKGVIVYASDFAPEETAKKPNGQLAMYGLGWLEKYGMIYEDITHVKLVVIQPRCEWVDEYEMPIDQFVAFADTIREAAGAVEMEKLAKESGDELTLVPGEKQCKFCNAKAICPALKNAVSSALSVISPSKPEDFADLTLPKQAAVVSLDESASSEKLAEFARAIPLIEEAVKAVQGEIERRLFAGKEVPGFYLGQGRKGRRSWTDPAVALKEMTKSGRLSVADATEKVPISPTEAEKKLKDRPAIWEKLQPFIQQSDGKATVCREGIDNNKPYAIASAPSDFAPIDDPKITTSKATVEGGGLFVEASDGSHVVIRASDCKGPIVKLARVGEPMKALLEKLGISKQIEELGEHANPADDAALAALMD